MRMGGEHQPTDEINVMASTTTKTTNPAGIPAPGELLYRGPAWLDTTKK
jgi:hypothetical protein